MWIEFETLHNTAEAPLYTAHKCIPREGKDTRLEPSGSIVGLTPPREFLLREGSSYTWLLNMNLYHEVVPVSNHVITFVERREYCEDIPTVLVPLGTQPDNDFDRYAFEEIAVQVYEEAMRLI